MTASEPPPDDHLYAPDTDWADFAEHRALLDAIWAGLSESSGQWHYLNPTARHSIWESCEDGSCLVMTYDADDGERLEELRAEAGLASSYLDPIAARFGLLRQFDA